MSLSAGLRIILAASVFGHLGQGAAGNPALSKADGRVFAEVKAQGVDVQQHVYLDPDDLPDEADDTGTEEDLQEPEPSQRKSLMRRDVPEGLPATKLIGAAWPMSGDTVGKITRAVDRAQGAADAVGASARSAEGVAKVIQSKAPNREVASIGQALERAANRTAVIAGAASAAGQGLEDLTGNLTNAGFRDKVSSVIANAIGETAGGVAAEVTAQQVDKIASRYVDEDTSEHVADMIGRNVGKVVQTQATKAISKALSMVLGSTAEEPGSASNQTGAKDLLANLSEAVKNLTMAVSQMKPNATTP